MANRATEELLGQLHEAVAKGLLDKILSGEASPADYSAAIRMLKDNKIEAIVEPGDTLDKIYQNLPTFDDEDEIA